MDLPRELRSADAVTAADRAIAYELPAERALAASSEQWARATFEGAPAVLRRFLVLGWRFVLGLRLGPPASPDHVLGWRITEALPNRMTLEAESALITGRNIAIVYDTAVTWTTLVRYKRPIAGPIWRLVELVHRRVLPYILSRTGAERAVRSVTDRSAAS